MRKLTCLGWATVAVLVVLSSTTTVLAGDDAMHGAARNAAEMTFGPLPGMPTCAAGSVQSGDPSKGSSFILAKMDTGCTIPWHWHTPNETLMVVSGAAQVQMKDGQPVVLKAGGFSSLPAKHVHQFHCNAACELYVYSDVPFDIHYIDAKGTEIPANQALKGFNEMAAGAPAGSR